MTKNLDVILLNNFRKSYGLFLNNVQIGQSEVNFTGTTLIIFSMEIEEKYRGKGFGKYFINWFENLARDKGYKTIIVQWVATYLSKILKDQGFKEMLDSDYIEIGANIQTSNIGKELNFIKNL